MWHKPEVLIIYSVRPLGQSVLKVKLGKVALDRGGAISDCFLSWLQAPCNLSTRETVERPKAPLSGFRKADLSGVLPLLLPCCVTLGG